MVQNCILNLHVPRMSVQIKDTWNIYTVGLDRVFLLLSEIYYLSFFLAFFYLGILFLKSKKKKVSK